MGQQREDNEAICRLWGPSQLVRYRDKWNALRWEQTVGLTETANCFRWRNKQALKSDTIKSKW